MTVREDLLELVSRKQEWLMIAKALSIITELGCWWEKVEEKSFPEISWCGFSEISESRTWFGACWI